MGSSKMTGEGLPRGGKVPALAGLVFEVLVPG
jgi:hypothetical protein